MPYSLYVHIPFCLKRCFYCDFVSGVYDPSRERVFLSSLVSELQYIPSGEPLETLYIGGGTPTVLSLSGLASLTSALYRRFTFKNGYEATIEANPGTLCREKLRALRRNGFNRISIGVQSFHQNELNMLGRIHAPCDAGHALVSAREEGFENIGVDLMYGVPGQTMGSWQASLERAVSLRPEHISIYELTIEKGTVLERLVREGRVSLKGEDDVLAMYDLGIDFLCSDGYDHYEISNFSLPGYRCRHNLCYWQRGEYYGAGPGAHSFTGSRRYSNTKDPDEYIRMLEGGEPPVTDSEEITDDKAFAETLFLGLRMAGGVDLPGLKLHYGVDLLRARAAELRELEQSGLVSFGGPGGVETNDAQVLLNGEHLMLTRKGMKLSNEVCAKLL